MNPFRSQDTLAFNTSRIVNRCALYLPPITSPARRKTLDTTSLATPCRPMRNRKDQRLPPNTHPRSYRRTWHANTFFKDLRCG